MRIHRDQSAGRNIDLVLRLEKVEARSLADRHDDGVAVEHGLAALIESRIETPVFVEHPLGLEGLQSHHAPVFTDHALRTQAGEHNDAFGLGLLDLLQSCGHLVAPLKANDVDLASAQSQCR